MAGVSAGTGAVAGVEVRLLGPVRVIGPAGAASLPGTRQRAVVALLALQAGAVVGRSRLVDAIWGRDAPRTAVKTLHSHITRVRQALAGCGLPGQLVTHDHGYALSIPVNTVDSHRFEEHVRQGRAQFDRADFGAATVSLRAGLALWHGDAAEDIALAGWGAAEVARLHEARLAALEQLWDAELRQGHHELATRELERLLVMHPTREHLAGLLMLAHYGRGGQAAALEVYQRLRAALADELGIDPGPRLQELYTAVLRRDPALTTDQKSSVESSRPGTAGAPATTTATTPKPAQLPAPVGHFTGRDEELQALDQLLTAAPATAPTATFTATPATTPTTAFTATPTTAFTATPTTTPTAAPAATDSSDGKTPVVVISGAAGMGKTALAVQWGHRVKDRFPDGQLFLDLRGHDRHAALGPAEALAHLLRGLGVAADRVPADLAERTGLYRSLLHDRRVLVVLDNAGQVGDVLPMVPAATAGLLLITSRARLAGLAAHHAVRLISLGVLRPGEALALLGRALGPDRTARESHAARRLTELCDRMPLALRIAAAKLAARPHSRIGDLVDELAAEDRLGALAVDGDSRSIRTVFASAYRALSPPAARLFRLLSLHPGVSASGHLAAAAAAVPLGPARAGVDELAAAHLLVQTGRDRYRWHDLIQLFARECAQVDETPHGRDAATGRMVDWYLAVAGAANQVIDPGRDRVPGTAVDPLPELPFPPRHHDALAFLDTERDNLVPVVRYAAEHGRHTAAWQLTYLLTGFFDSRGHWQERVGMCHWGLAAARATGEPAVEGLMRSGLGVACIMTRRFDEALTHLDRALVLMRAGGDRRGEGHTYNNIAAALSHLRRFEEAVQAYQQALAVHTASGYDLGRAVALNNIGDAYVRMGEAERGIGYLTQALAISRRIGNQRLEAAARNGLGQGALRRGAHREALDHLGQALALRRQAGDRRYAAHTCADLGTAHLQGGDPAAAAGCLREALTLSRQIADQHVEAIARYRLGLAHLAAGELAAARFSLRLALLLRRQVPDPYEEANVHRGLGDAAHAEGDPQTARRHWDLAIELYGRAHATAEAGELATLVQASRSRSGW